MLKKLFSKAVKAISVFPNKNYIRNPEMWFIDQRRETRTKTQICILLDYMRKQTTNNLIIYEKEN